MGRNNWEPEDGMGFAGMVPTLAEKRVEREEDKAQRREHQLRADLMAEQQRNRELTRQVEQLQDDCKQAADCWLKELERADDLQARMDAAEKLLRGSRTWMSKHMDCNSCYAIVDRIEEWLALTASPSSAPTDPGRADTKEKRRIENELFAGDLYSGIKP